jgi:hypothetical protein
MQTGMLLPVIAMLHTSQVHLRCKSEMLTVCGMHCKDAAWFEAPMQHDFCITLLVELIYKVIREVAIVSTRLANHAD